MSFFRPTPFRQTYLSYHMVNTLREGSESSEGNISSNLEHEADIEENEGRQRDIDEEAISFSGEGYETDYSDQHVSENIEESNPSYQTMKNRGEISKEGEPENVRSSEPSMHNAELEQLDIDDESVFSKDCLIDMEIMEDESRKERDRISILSTECNILFNKKIEDERKKGNPDWGFWTVKTWDLLDNLALPELTSSLCIYVRHCDYVLSNCIKDIMKEMKDIGKESNGKNPFRFSCVPFNFEKEILPKVKNILKKVQARRWKCSLSKKYQDCLCSSVHCPEFKYEKENINSYENREKEEGERGESGLFPSSLESFYSMSFFKAKKVEGDPFREVKREVNVSSTISNDSHKMVPILWSLEYKLISLIHFHKDWIIEERSCLYFPQLNDSRVLYSMHDISICNKSIMEYNIKEIRDALGRLHWRWNDISPSDDLFDYFNLLKERCALLSFLSKVDKITIFTKHNERRKKHHLSNEISNISIKIFDSSGAFSHFIGSNQKTKVLSLCSDLIFNGKEQVSNEKSKTSSLQKISKKESMRRYFLRKKRINKKIEREIKSMGSGFSSLYDTNYGKPSLSNGVNSIQGDPEKQPRIIRVNLDRGANLLDYSSSEDDDDEKDDIDFSRERIQKTGKRRKTIDNILHREKNKKKDLGTYGQISAESSENYFENKSYMDQNIYEDLGKNLTDNDICEEILTRKILSSVKDICIDMKKYDDIEDYLDNTFMNCLSTSLHLNKKSFVNGDSNKKTNGKKEGVFSCTCVTRTNLSFLMETHSIICEMNEDMNTWDTLVFLSSESLGNIDKRKRFFRYRTPKWIEKRDRSLNYTSMEYFPKYLIENVSEQIEYEKCKIESVISWAYDYCNGKRNQFMSRNIRELFFSHYLLPGEIEILINVNHLTNSSITPSIIVSRLRNDVERLDKIIYEFTLYNTIKEFAKENGCKHEDGKIPSIRLGKNIYNFISNNLGKDNNDKNVVFKKTNRHNTFESNPSEISRFYKAIQFAQECSLRDMISTHTNYKHQKLKKNKKQKEKSDQYKKQVDPVDLIYPSYEHLNKLSKYAPNISFINPNISMNWKSPRGITQILRVIFLQCLEFFLKEIHHSLEAKRFFFTKRMTTNLMHDPTFIEAVEEIENNIKNDKSEDKKTSEENMDLPSEGEGNKESEIEALQGNGGDDAERESDADLSEESTLHRIPDRSEVFELLFRETETQITEENIKIYASFRFYMYNIFELECQRIYNTFPVVLYCMNSSFVFFPEKCFVIECNGADKLLGYYSWLDCSIRFISERIIPILFCHFNFSIEEKGDFIREMRYVIEDPHITEIERMQRMKEKYAKENSKYSNSPYSDGGIYYRDLLNIIGNMPSLGQKNKYSKMCYYLCKAIIQLCYILYPDILERNHIHVPPPCNKDTYSSEMRNRIDYHKDCEGDKVENVIEEEGSDSIFVFKASLSDM